MSTGMIAPAFAGARGSSVPNSHQNDSEIVTSERLPKKPVWKEVRTPRHWNQALNPSEFKVAYALKAYLNENTGLSFPGQDTLADETNLARTTVNGAVRKLEKKGFIRKYKRKTGTNANCVYIFTEWAMFPETGSKDVDYVPEPMSKKQTSDVQKTDTNLFQNNLYSLSRSDDQNISEWTASEQTVLSINELAPDMDAPKYVARFKAKVEKYGYQFKDFDEAVLDWATADVPKNRYPKLKKALPDIHVSQAEIKEREEVVAVAACLQEGRVVDSEIPPKDRFKGALIHVSKAKGPNFYKNWFSKIDLASIDNGVGILRGQNAFIISTVVRDHSEMLLEAARTVGMPIKCFRTDCN